jgi:V8-like Glu-specific endopeptidase
MWVQIQFSQGVLEVFVSDNWQATYQKLYNMSQQDKGHMYSASSVVGSIQKDTLFHCDFQPHRNGQDSITHKSCWNTVESGVIYILYFLEKILIYQYILSLNFLDRVQNVNISDCLSCTAGMYCQHKGHMYSASSVVGSIQKDTLFHCDFQPHRNGQDYRHMW